MYKEVSRGGGHFKSGAVNSWETPLFTISLAAELFGAFLSRPFSAPTTSHPFFEECSIEQKKFVTVGRYCWGFPSRKPVCLLVQSSKIGLFLSLMITVVYFRELPISLERLHFVSSFACHNIFSNFG